MEKSNGRTAQGNQVMGAFVTVAGERYYVIENVDKMPPFFISLVSDSDHWMFISSNGGLTAGRVSPDTALFPYITVDRIYESTPHTGSKTLVRAVIDGQCHYWEPFNREHDDRYAVQRNLYKNVLGNKLMFEEVNVDLNLAFRYRWASSDQFGFVRHCDLENLAKSDCEVELIDGLQNLLPAGTPRFTQTNSSYLVDAYKWSELDQATGLAFFALYSAITDRAEPCESLKATTAFCLGFEPRRILLSADQLDAFRRGEAVVQEKHKRGIRGAYLVNAALTLQAGSCSHWQLVVNLEQSQVECAGLLQALRKPEAVADAISASVEHGSDRLARIMAAGDGFQLTAEETVTAHHYANTLFNILRGGIFDDQYMVHSRHFSKHTMLFNATVYARHSHLLKSLPEKVNWIELRTLIREQGDTELERIGNEYLPITFGRRHGDPSRPWNQFAITLTDSDGERLLSYQGNWRDIFQNWEALLFGYPEFIENVIAKFVNASTLDGFNPYRISNEGIDWEVEEPDDPWSYIGYWGDHQIIYLLKLLELSQQFHPDRLGQLLHRPIYSYANVPYKIKPFQDLLEDAKSTVVYDYELADLIERRVADLGADGKLLLGQDGRVYQVNLLEKLLIPLLCKLGNLVLDGGIWLNTQRPEWNDANNALVGHGLSMVTLYYLRRYVCFIKQLLCVESGEVSVSTEVGVWLTETAAALADMRSHTGAGPVTADYRYECLSRLGLAASRYRHSVYQRGCFTGAVSLHITTVEEMLADALAAIDHSIASNLREDGLYNAYNLLNLKSAKVEIDKLYPMLEGQVAALSSGAITPVGTVETLEALFSSQIFRPDQNSFLLYPDRELPGFLQKNCIPADRVAALPVLATMLDQNDHSIIDRDASGVYRFNANLTNVGALNKQLDTLSQVYGSAMETARENLQALYEEVFRHKAFTGRSGGMFGFEGLGSIYWHMVSKLLLAVQENFFSARQQQADDFICQRIGQLYYRVRNGIGFNKSPIEYGAFPMDPYSHTPLHSGAQQPGMTGQVKEEIIARFGELGVRVHNGTVAFDPGLLRAREFITTPRSFRFLDVDGEWRDLDVPPSGLGFTWCQVPLVYLLRDTAEPTVTVFHSSGKAETLPGLGLPEDVATEIFQRSGKIRQIELALNKRLLLSE